MPEMYYNVRRHEDGTEEIVGYAYGDEWVAQAMYMDDLKFKTPEEAVVWWEKNYGYMAKKD